MRGSRKTVNGAYRYRYAPFLVPIYDALALPLGELSPQVTERALRPRDVICLRRCQHFPIDVAVICPSPSSLLLATSPTGRGKGCWTETVLRPSDFRAARALRGSRKTEWSVSIQIRSISCANIRCLGSPLGELSPQVTERALRPRDVICLRRCQHFPIDVAVICSFSVLAALATSPTGRGKGCRTETVLRPSDFRAARALRGSRKTGMERIDTDTLHFLCQYTMPWLSLWESCHRR